MDSPAAGDAAAPHYPDKSRLLVRRTVDGLEHPIRDSTEWRVRREHILTNMQLVMGPLPPRSDLAPLDTDVLETVGLPVVVRRKVTFVSESGDRVPAYLMTPKDLVGKAPAMLCLHQTTRAGKSEPAGLEGEPNMHYALEMAERGYITLSPDYPNFGDHSFEPYQNGYASATMKGVWDHMRAVDLLVSLPEVDERRIGCMGHSLGGHNAMFAGVFDTRLRVMVSSCGFNAFSKYRGGDLAGWSGPNYMPRIAEIYGNDARKMPFDFTEVVAALAPRSFFVNAPLSDDNFEVSGVWDCLDAAAPVYELLGAANDLVAAHPDTGHDFPPEIRERAYAFVDRVLKT